MKELITIDNLDVTQLSKKKLLDYFALTISQEQPHINAKNIVNQNWEVMAINNESPKYKEINSMVETLPDKSLEELIAIRDTFIKKDTEKLNEINKEIQQYQDNVKIQEAEYREQRKNLTGDSLIKHMNFKSTKEFETKFIGSAETEVPQEQIGCLSVVIGILMGTIFFNFLPVEVIGENPGYGERVFLMFIVYLGLAFIILPILYKLIKRTSWNNKVSKASNINNFLKKLPLDLAQEDYKVKNGKLSRNSYFEGFNYDYANSLDYSVTLNVEEYKKNLERAKILEEHISIWKDKGEEFLVSVKNSRLEFMKKDMLDKSNTRLGKAMPEQWTKNRSEEMIEISLIFSSLISSGRADTWKEAANLYIEDKYKQSVLKELRYTRESMIDTMIATGERIRESISADVYQMTNDISSNIVAEGIRNQSAMNNVSSSLGRLEVVNSAILIENLIR